MMLNAQKVNMNLENVILLAIAVEIAIQLMYIFINSIVDAMAGTVIGQ